MAYPECAGCGKNLAKTGGATITIGSLKSHLKKRFPDGYVQVHACNSREAFVEPECFAAAWRKYSTTEPPER
jgi:hypothetical protein